MERAYLAMQGRAGCSILGCDGRSFRASAAWTRKDAPRQTLFAGRRPARPASTAPPQTLRASSSTCEGDRVTEEQAGTAPSATNSTRACKAPGGLCHVRCTASAPVWHAHTTQDQGRPQDPQASAASEGHRQTSCGSQQQSEAQRDACKQAPGVYFRCDTPPSRSCAGLLHWRSRARISLVQIQKLMKVNGLLHLDQVSCPCR